MPYSDRGSFPGDRPPPFREPSGPPTFFVFMWFAVLSVGAVMVLFAIGNALGGRRRKDGGPDPLTRSNPTWFFPGPTETTPLNAVVDQAPPPPYDGHHGVHPGPPTHDAPVHHPAPAPAPDPGHSHH